MPRVPGSILLALVVLAVGCGGGQDGPPQPLGPGGLRRALDVTRAAGRLPVRLEVTTTRPGRGTRPQFSAEGNLDVAKRAGDATLDFKGAEDLGLPLAVSWTADQVSVHDKTWSRANARANGGQLGMLPDELQGLVELVADGRSVRERSNGSWTFTVTPAAAVRRGIPAQPPAGDMWTGEAQAAADGRLRRVVLRLPTPALGAAIPAGTATVQLELG